MFAKDNPLWRTINRQMLPWLSEEAIQRHPQKGKRKVQRAPQSQTAAFPRHQEEEETDKHKSNKRTKSTKISSLFPKRGNRNAKRTEKHKNKITQGQT